MRWRLQCLIVCSSPSMPQLWPRAQHLPDETYKGHLLALLPGPNRHLTLLEREGCKSTTLNFIIFFLFKSTPPRPIATVSTKSSNFIWIRSRLDLKQLCTNEILIITHICTYYLSFNFLLSRKWKNNVKFFIFSKSEADTYPFCFLCSRPLIWWNHKSQNFWGE